MKGDWFLRDKKHSVRFRLSVKVDKKTPERTEWKRLREIV